MGYDKEKEEYLSTFKKYDFLKKLWLVHIKEYKDVNEYAENGNYSPEYDIIVAEMPLDYYIDMREYLQSIVYKSKGKVLKVVLSESDLGRKFISEVAPFYIND